MLSNSKKSIKSSINDTFDNLSKKIDGISTNLSDEYHDSNFSKMEKYLFKPDILEPRKMSLSRSNIRNRYKGLVVPDIKFLDIDYILKESYINYDEMEQEQGYINNRLIPYMKEHKLSYPIVEIYNDLVDNQKPIDELTGKRPKTHIYIPDGNHRIVAMKRLGFKRIPAIVYQEPIVDNNSIKSETIEKLNELRSKVEIELATKEDIPFYENEKQEITNVLQDYQHDHYPDQRGNMTVSAPKRFIDTWKQIIYDTGTENHNKYQLMYDWLDTEHGLARNEPEVIFRIVNVILAEKKNAWD